MAVKFSTLHFFTFLDLILCKGFCVCVCVCVRTLYSCSDGGPWTFTLYSVFWYPDKAHTNYTFILTFAYANLLFQNFFAWGTLLAKSKTCGCQMICSLVSFLIHMSKLWICFHKVYRMKSVKHWSSANKLWCYFRVRMVWSRENALLIM